MLVIFLRAGILYLVLILSIRLMGKRQLGEMEPAEFVVSMLLANLAVVPMQEPGIPLLWGLVPILVVLAIELLVSVLIYHSAAARRFFCGKPVILVEKGRMLQENMKKTRVNPDELTEYLRLQGVVDLASVQYAILETGGSISTLLKPKYAPAPAKDGGVKVEPLRLPVALVMNGRVMTENLAVAGRTRAWVEEQLARMGCRPEDVFFFTAEPGGRLYLSVREGAEG